MSQYIHNKFAEYYQKHSHLLQPPTSLEKREFGFLLVKEGIMLRHKCFRDVDTLRSAIKTIVPSDVYYSSAYYESPEAEMKEKDWLGADLIFDIDADHIPIPCVKNHNTWICRNCGAVGKGVTPEKCFECGNQKFNEQTWPCEVCLEAAKAETMKLVDILMKDFGFSQDELRVGFSGHRGYHIHVESKEIRELNSIARKEIVDYVHGIGLEITFHGLEIRGNKKSRILVGPELHNPGWRGRIARGTYDFLLTATAEDLKKIGLKKKVITTIIQHKEVLLESWKERGPWGAIKGIGPETWKKIAHKSVKMQSVKIDTVVTTDIHRLIRLTNTLHGKTGLKKMVVPITDLENFDPLKRAVSFREGIVTIFVMTAPQFRIGDQTYGPYMKQRLELPTAAALFLLCKGTAKVVE